jgi:mono/diheme cytochrome c family protein
MQIAFKWLMLANTIITFSADASSAQNIDVGKAEYQSGCASCHGADAKGNGPVSTQLKTRPADLTVLAKKNNGVFPVNAVYQIIDGRDSIPSHGTREMPIWGWRFVLAEHFNLKGADDYIYLPPASPEPVVHSRIMGVIDYLNRIQEK